MLLLTFFPQKLTAVLLCSVQMKNLTKHTRMLGAWISRNRKSARQSNYRSHTSISTNRLVSILQEECCCMAPRAPAKPCLSRQLPTTPQQPLSVSLGQSLCRST
eukprot:Lithocolla_globosa_v1_NODE_1291_length_2696_cov_80.316925.p3 type:complete len:104 gc:universal NODE_1291_length_2696_cov_80.316925:2299-1988(-)